MNLEIMGIPEQMNEKPEVIVLQVAQKINQTITRLVLRIIIAMFKNRQSRNAVYEGRRKMKSVSTKDIGIQGAPAGKIFINENLVPTSYTH